MRWRKYNKITIPEMLYIGISGISHIRSIYDRRYQRMPIADMRLSIAGTGLSLQG